MNREVFLLSWWRQGGSNSRPPACKAGALPSELYPHSKTAAELGSRRACRCHIRHSTRPAQLSHFHIFLKRIRFRMGDSHIITSFLHQNWEESRNPTCISSAFHCLWRMKHGADAFCLKPSPHMFARASRPYFAGIIHKSASFSDNHRKVWRFPGQMDFLYK